jgi:hypothetical protein
VKAFLYRRLKIIIKNSGHSPLKKMGGWRKATRVAITLKNQNYAYALLAMRQMWKKVEISQS